MIRLTEEQLTGMSMWDRDPIVSDRGRPIVAMLVRQAIAEIRAYRAAKECLRSVVEEAIAWAHQQSLARSFEEHLADRIAEQLGDLTNADLATGKPDVHDGPTTR